MSKEPYYIGLTVGPEYAAYAVTNESYNLERFKGQDMWGIYKFKEAETSANRTAIRRRLCRLHRLYSISDGR